MAQATAPRGDVQQRVREFLAQHDGSVRLPLEVGQSALADSIRFVIFVWLIPVLLLVVVAVGQAIDGLLGEESAAAGAITVIGGLAYILIIIPLSVGMAVETAVRAKRLRPADAVFDEAGLSIAGGVRPKSFGWASIDPARTVLEEDDTHLRWGWWMLSVLALRRSAGLNRRGSVPVLKLRLVTRGEPDVKRVLDGAPDEDRKPGEVIAEAEEESERESLRAVFDTLQAIVGSDEDAPNVIDERVSVGRCPECGALAPLVDAPAVRCGFCGGNVAISDDVRARVRAAVEQAGAASTEERVNRVLDQPHPGGADAAIRWGRRLLLLAVPALVVGFSIVVYRWSDCFQLHHMVAGGGLTPDGNSIALTDSETPGDLWILGPSIGFLASLFLSVIGLVGVVLSRRQALRVLTLDLGALPPRRPGEPSQCHSCGAPLLQPAQGIATRCLYCQADNVLGIDVRPGARRVQRQKTSLEQVLGYRRRALLRLGLLGLLASGLVFFCGRELLRIDRRARLSPCVEQLFGEPE